MKRLTFVWLILLFGGCSNTENRTGIQYVDKLEQTEVIRDIDQFLGQSFEGISGYEFERTVERYFIGWEAEQLWQYLLERKKARDVHAILRRFPDAISVSFCFVGKRDNLYDMTKQSIDFMIGNGRVERVDFSHTNIFGLAWSDIPPSDAGEIRIMKNSYPKPSK